MQEAVERMYSGRSLIQEHMKMEKQFYINDIITAINIIFNFFIKKKNYE